MTGSEATGALAPSNNGQLPQATKREYKSPVLVAYGSVRQLTGAVSGKGSDSAGMRGDTQSPRLVR
jgi:hypothetical protein